MEEFERKVLDIANKYSTYGNLIIYNQNIKDTDICFGYSDKEKSILMTKETLFSFPIQSVLLINIAIYQLVERKIIKLNDTLDKYIPNFKEGRKIQIIDLLTSKSGLKDYLNEKVKVYQQKEFYTKMPIKKQQLYDFKYETKRINDDDYLDFLNNFEIVEKFKNNYLFVNYFLCKLIIQNVTKLKLYEYLKKYIFDKLNINITPEFNKSLKSYYVFFDYTSAPLAVDNDIEECFSISFNDLGKFYYALFHNKILTTKSFNALLPKKDEFSGTALYYEEGFICGDLLFQVSYSSAMYNKSNDCLVVLTRNRWGKRLYTETVIKSFYFDLIGLVKEKYFAYNNPKFIPLSYRNIDSALAISVFPKQYRFVGQGAANVIAYCSTEKNSHIYIVLDNEIAVGLCCLIWSIKDNLYQISSVMVDKKYQQKGYGKFMIKEALKVLQEKGAKKILISLEKINIPAFKTYTACGFKPFISDSTGYDLQWSID